MTDLETLIVFTLMFLPALIFWIITIAYVTNKVFDAIERDKQLLDGYTFDCYGYAHKKDEINDCSYKSKERDEYLKRDSDFKVAEFNYVTDRLNDYLNSDKATLEFQYIFGSVDSHENKKAIWEKHLSDLRKRYEDDFDNL